MKKIVRIMSFLTLSILGITVADSQVYQFSQVDPTFSFNVGSSGINGPLTASNSTFSDTVTINQANGTIDNSGSVTISGSMTTLTYEQSQTLPPIFPNPPQTVTGDATVTFQLLGGTYDFDTGVEPLSYQNGNVWAFADSSAISLPVDIAYTLVTGGATYSGSVEAFAKATLHPGSTIDVANYPTSIQLAPGTGPSISFNGSAGGAIDFTAADGFLFTAGVAPEPSSLKLLALGALAFLFMTRGRFAQRPRQA